MTTNSGMAIGSMNRRIQIQQQTTAQDEYGEPQSTWTTVYTCWANVDTQRSQLIYATAEFIGKVTYRITFRWTASVVVKPNMRIVYVDQATGITHTYNVEALMNPEFKNWLIVALCYELEGQE